MRQKMKKGGSVKKMNMGGPVPLQPGSGSPIQIGGNGPIGSSGPNIGGIPMRGRPLTPQKIGGQRGPGGVLNFAYGGAVGFRARKDAIRGMMGGSGKAGVTKLKKGSKKSGVVKKKSGKKRSR